MERLNELKDNYSSVFWAGISIRTMFILLFAIPILTSLLKARDEYDARIEEMFSENSSSENNSTDERFRFAIPNFMSGFASAIDWNGDVSPKVEELYGEAKTPEEADTKALGKDWKAITGDLVKVLKKYESKSTG